MNEGLKRRDLTENSASGHNCKAVCNNSSFIFGKKCIDSGKTPANQHLDIDISSRTPNFHGYATLSEDPPNWSAPIKYLHYSTFALDTCPFFTPITVL
ncbi:uncharacterized protein LOC125849044 isoform X2 [Solanum stenotomum]|uniref:uncharacterized protein LOC125849044 isoform X2 n=1 Tax=Solanum stenotomum TaxID=172797 RepID=UPI0020D099F0|nr:uncharacterized protein LOC125849044 isoform X2 [Solanum stenotomum]